MPSRWYKHPALPTGAPPFQSCLCAKAEALPVRIGYGWGSRRISIYAALTDTGYRIRFRCGMARFSGMAELPFPRHCSLHGFSTLCAGPVFLPAYSEFSIKVWTICWRCGMMVLDSGINGYAGAGRSLPWCWRFSAVMRTWCKCNNK